MFYLRRVFLFGSGFTRKYQWNRNCIISSKSCHSSRQIAR